MLILIALIVVILVGNFLKLNSLIARQSVPIAAYTTLYPFPFHIESSYSEGTFQGIRIGGKIDETVVRLTNYRHCRLMVDGRLIEMHDADLAPLNDGELVLRCKSGGIAWNQILVIEDGLVQGIRVAGGLWL